MFTFVYKMYYVKLFFCFLFTAILAVTFPRPVLAKTSGISIADIPVTNESIIDSNIRKQPVKADDRKPDERNKDGRKVDLSKPDIKVIPKAKRQLKPAALNGRIKIPVKRVKPIIKRPVGLVRKHLGI